MHAPLLLLLVLVLALATPFLASLPCASAAPVLYATFHGGKSGINNIYSYSLTGATVRKNVLRGDDSNGAHTDTHASGSSRSQRPRRMR